MDFKTIEKLQTFLPLGYFYLIVLGLLKDGVFFYILGINFIKFSSITDVLMSPIADITSQPILLISVIVIIFIFFLYYEYQAKNSHKNWIRNFISYKRFLTKNENATEQDLKKFIRSQFYYASFFMIASFFLGGGIGFGISSKKRIENNKMKFNYRITYNSGKSADIYLVDSNSVYYFFVEKGQKNITIAPTGSVEKVEIIKNRMLD